MIESMRRFSACAVAIGLLTFTATAAQAQAARYQFDLPAQSLADALRAVGNQTSKNILFDPALVEGVNAPPLRAQLTVSDAINQLIAGTTLSVEAVASDTVLIQSRDRGAAAAAKAGKPIAGTGTETGIAHATYIRSARAYAASPPGAGAADQSSTAQADDRIAAGNDSQLGQLDEIIVTGLKRLSSIGKIDVPILEAPQSISVISKERLETMMPQTVMQVLNYTAGVRSSVYFDTRRDDFFIRGFAESGRSGVFRDGLRLPATARYGFWEIDPYGLERVEVMRGPASVLYGQSSPGGLVNLVSKRPMSTARKELGLTYGSFDRIQATFDIGGPMDGEGKWLYRFTGLGRDGDTQTSFTRDDRAFVAPALTWQPSEATSLTVLGNYQKGLTSGAPQFLPIEGTVLANPNGRLPIDVYTGEPAFDTFDKTQTSLAYLFEHKFGADSAFLQSFRYGKLGLDYQVVYGGGLDTADASMQTLNRGSLLSDEHMDALSVDNQIQTRWTSGSFDHNLLFGADFQRSTGDFKYGFGGAPTLNIYHPVYGQAVTPPAFTRFLDRTAKQIGVYAQDHLKISDKLIVRVAGRYDWAKSEGTNPSTGVQTEDLDDKAGTIQGGISYLFDSGFTPYAGYSTSFSPIAGADFFGNAFKPEEGKQVEVGFKYSLRNLRALATVAVFDLRKQNVPMADPDPAHIAVDPFAQAQAGEIRSRGVEFELTANPHPGLNLIGAITHNNVDVTKGDGAGGVVPDDYHADDLVSAWADYTLQRGALAGFGMGLGVRYASSVEVSGAFPGYGPPGPFKVPSSTVADAVLSYEWNKYHFAVNASNLFDKQYSGACDAFSCYYAMRRTILATARYQW